MSETETVKEARRWHQQVYEQTHNLTAAQRRAREDELLRAAREAGVEFENVIDTDTEPAPTQSSGAPGSSTSGSSFQQVVTVSRHPLP